jgi:hypothetical protein
VDPVATAEALASILQDTVSLALEEQALQQAVEGQILPLRPDHAAPALHP